MAEKASVVISAVDQATEVIKKVTGQFEGLQSHWGKLTAALGIGAGFTALTTLVNNAIQAGDRLGELSQITGVSVKTLSELQLAAKNSGLDIEQVAGILGKMNKGLAEVEQPGQSAARGLGMLGINAEAFKRAKVEDRIFMLADAAKDADNSTGDLSRALDLVVKGGSALIPMLSGGSDELREQMELAKKLGLSLTDDAATGMDTVADTLGMIKMQGEGFGNMLAQKLLPTLEGLSKMWLDNATEAGGFADVVGTAVEGGLKTIVSAGMLAYGSLKQLGSLFAGLMAAATLVMQGEGKAALEALKMGYKDAELAGESMRESVQKLWKDELPKTTEAEKTTAKAIREREEAHKKSTEQAKKATDQDKKAREEAKKLAEQEDKLRKSIFDKVEQLELSVRQTEKQTDASKLLAEIEKLEKDGKLQLTDEQKRNVEQRILAAEATRLQAERDKELIDEEKRLFDQEVKNLEQLKESVRNQDELNDTLGMSQQEIDAYKIKLEEKRLAELDGKLSTLEMSEELRAMYQSQRDELQKLIDKMRAGDLKAAAIEQKKAITDNWVQMAGDIEKALTDALVQGFSNGKSIARSIGDWIVNYFKTTIARGIAQALTGAIVSGLSGIANAVGLGGGTNAAGGIGNLSSLFNLGSLGTAGSNFLGGLTGTLTGIFGEAGIGGTFSAGFEALMSGNLAGALGSLGPYAAAAAGLYALISGVGTGRARGEALQDYDVIYGNSGYTRANNIYPTPNTAGPGGGGTNEYLRGIIDIAKEITATLGGTFDESTGFGTLISSSSDGLGAQVVGSVFDELGNLIYDRNVNGANDQVDDNLAAMTPGMILAALQESNFGDEIDRIFDSLNANTVTGAQLDAALARAEEVKAAQEQAADDAAIESADSLAENTIILRDNSEVLEAMRDILDKLKQITSDGLAATSQAATDAGNAVVAAVNTLATRPIEVTVEASEVNGGV